jgi:hypothetical protein
MRAAYLLWLQGGRCDSKAPIGQVMLYLYGLERRAVHDVRTDPTARAELPAIRAEIERLLSVYGRHARFKERAGALSDFLAAQGAPASSYLTAPGVREGPLTHTERVALAQCAQDGARLPPAWALRLSVSLLQALLQDVPPTPREKLAAYFIQLYGKHHGPGIVLPAGSRRLQLKYWPDSPTFDGTLKWVTVDTSLPAVAEGDLPPELSGLVQEMARQLARSGGRVPEVAAAPPVPSPRGEYLARPTCEWPDVYRRFLETLRAEVLPGRLTEKWLTELVKAFTELQMLTLEKYRTLCEALAREGIGVHPDPRFSDRMHGQLVLFREDPATAATEPSAAYRACTLLVDLTSVVIASDNQHQFSPAAMLAQLHQEPGLTLSERMRLAAHLHLAMLDPLKLPSLQRQVQALASEERTRTGERLVGLVRLGHGSTLRGKPLKRLLRCFEMLGLDTDQVFDSDAVEPRHARSGTPSNGYRIPPRPTAAVPARVELDFSKVAALHQEQERVSALLDPVFSTPRFLESAPAVISGVDARLQQDRALGRAGLLGLDPVASAFLDVLLGKASWTRAELGALARAQGLPLDGVLERLNEASYEQLDMPLFDDGDPLVLRPEAVVEIATHT